VGANIERQVIAVDVMGDDIARAVQMADLDRAAGAEWC
jgi:hypothetical protein